LNVRLTSAITCILTLFVSTPFAGPLTDAAARGRARERDDLAAMQVFRPSYAFWRHIFSIPDGSIVFGSARDGRLLATFPIASDWTQQRAWIDAGLPPVWRGRPLPADLSQRRDVVAELLESSVGPVVHNASRGLFVAPNVVRYGDFLGEWGAIYERFGVPAHIGLAQALVESGFSGTVQSEAQAVGLCQWLRGNWRRLQQLAPHPIEAQNQTTQAAYCAAYLTVLATKYGSFIPALSEHHAGGTNVGRTLINGARLGGASTRDRYFLGADFARDLRTFAPGVFSDVYGTYGPRSFLYAEMIFGNAVTVDSFVSTTPQRRIFATRVRRPVSLERLATITKLSSEELRRYNPALTARVPANGTVYLPRALTTLGADVSFWHRSPKVSYASALDRFMALDVTLDEWNGEPFDAVLERFERQFAATKTEEGAVMATVLAYVLQDRQTSREREILRDFAGSDHVRQRFSEAQRQRAAYLEARTALAAVR
jgi:hypothetical protein